MSNFERSSELIAQTITSKEVPELSQRAAMITLARVKNYSELNADTLQEGDELFKNKTRELWEEIVVSGRVYTEKNGEMRIQSETDLDGRCALGILKLAGISMEKLRYVAPGTFEENVIHVDTGNRDGVSVDVLVNENGVMEPLLTAALDHHGNESGKNTSAADLAYKTVVELGLLNRTPALDALVEFVTHVDNRTYPNEEKYYKDSYRTVLGLERYMSFEQVKKYFESGRSPVELLTPTDIQGMNLEWQSKKEKQNIQASLGALETMERDGFIVPSSEYGKIVVDISDGKNKRVPGGYMAVKSKGYGGYIIWSGGTQSFFVSTAKPLRLSLPQGKLIRQTMWIKARQDQEPLKVTLQDIIDQLAGGRYSPRDKLRDYLRNEKKGVVTLKFGK